MAKKATVEKEKLSKKTINSEVTKEELESMPQCSPDDSEPTYQLSEIPEENMPQVVELENECKDPEFHDNEADVHAPVERRHKQDIIDIATVCHEANKAWAEANGDLSHKHWGEATDEEREHTIINVDNALQYGTVLKSNRKKEILFCAIINALK